MSKIYKVEKYGSKQALDENIGLDEIGLIVNDTDDVSIYAKLDGVITDLKGEPQTIIRGRKLAYATTSSWYYDIPVDGVKAGDYCFVQRASAVSVANANYPIASEARDGAIRVYFNQQSSSTYYVNYIVIPS